MTGLRNRANHIIYLNTLYNPKTVKNKNRKHLDFKEHQNVFGRLDYGIEY
jgi:hypothetical protein